MLQFGFPFEKYWNEKKPSFCQKLGFFFPLNDFCGRVLATPYTIDRNFHVR